MDKMNGKEFKKALDNIVAEKDIDPEVVYSAMELALTSAYKKNFNSKTNVKVLFDRNTGDIKVFSFLTVVPDDKMTKEEYDDALFEKYAEDDELDTEVEEKAADGSEGEENEEVKETVSFFNPETEIKLSDAKKIDKTLEVGDTIDTEVTPHDFGRVAASTAKQVVVQKIREAERNSIIEEFADKQDEIMVGMLAMEDAKNYYIDLGRTRGILPKSEMIPGETVKMGSSIKVYLSKIESTTKGPLILCSRKNTGFVKRLFESEIPELADGTLVLYNVAREPGVRSKVAVYSTDSRIDPIGTCIGERGSRIGSILSELNGEKVDLIRYDEDEATFIANALSPAQNVIVNILDNEKTREALAIVNDENLSLAIGKKGINIKLASKLTRFRINVKTLEQVTKEGNEN